MCKRDREKERGREGTNLGCAEQTDALVARDIHTCATSIPGALATFSDGDAEAVDASPRWVEILCGHALEKLPLMYITHSLTHSLTHGLNLSRSHSLTHSLTHFLRLHLLRERERERRRERKREREREMR